MASGIHWNLRYDFRRLCLFFVARRARVQHAQKVSHQKLTRSTLLWSEPTFEPNPSSTWKTTIHVSLRLDFSVLGVIVIRPMCNSKSNLSNMECLGQFELTKNTRNVDLWNFAKKMTFNFYRSQPITMRKTPMSEEQIEVFAVTSIDWSKPSLAQRSLS